jgi:hypothetical protein
MDAYEISNENFGQVLKDLGAETTDGKAFFFSGDKFHFEKSDKGMIVYVGAEKKTPSFNIIASGTGVSQKEFDSFKETMMEEFKKLSENLQTPPVPPDEEDPEKKKEKKPEEEKPEETKPAMEGDDPEGSASAKDGDTTPDPATTPVAPATPPNTIVEGDPGQTPGGEGDHDFGEGVPPNYSHGKGAASIIGRYNPKARRAMLSK